MTRQSVGRTFLVAMSLLGLAASLQIAALVWQLFHPSADEAQAPPQAMTVQEVPTAPAVPTPEAQAPAAPAPEATALAKTEAPAQPAPMEATAAASTPTAEPAGPSREEEMAAEAEKQLLASQAEKQLIASLPKPTPVPVRRENLIEARISGLVNLARTLRDRGDTSTALTRLREAQAISPENPQIISEMAMTYEKMGLGEKAAEQWRRIYAIGEQAGIYYAAAEAKLRTPERPAENTAYVADPAAEAWLMPGEETQEKVLSLGKVGTTDDTGNSQPQRHLKVRIPIQAKAGKKIDVHEVVIQVYFYDELKDGSVVETNANVSSSWVRRMAVDGGEASVDWTSPEPEVLEVAYSQSEQAPTPAPKTRGKARRAPERRNYFGYVVRVYYKGDLNATHAEPEKLLTQFPPPATLQTSDLPQ